METCAKKCRLLCHLIRKASKWSIVTHEILNQVQDDDISVHDGDVKIINEIL
jgi:hypothetical protein